MNLPQNDPQQTHYRAQVTDELSLSQAVEQFTQHARIHGRSRKTLALYEWVFEQVYGAIGDISLNQLDTLKLRHFLSELLERQWKPTSVSIMHGVLNVFLNWTVRERLIESNPLDGIPAPKVAKVFPYVLEESQIRALLGACDKSTLQGVRNYAMPLLFVDCGLRLNELIGLRLADVSLAQRSLKVHGKGSRDRIVFMRARMAKALRRWLELRSSKLGYSDALFIDRKGEPLKPRWVQQVIACLGKRAGINGVRVSPHTLRHTAATLAVKNGMEPFALQRLFGWEDISTALTK